MCTEHLRSVDPAGRVEDPPSLPSRWQYASHPRRRTPLPISSWRCDALSFTTSPLDKRVKLFKLGDLDKLKNAPRSPHPAGTVQQSE